MSITRRSMLRRIAGSMFVAAGALAQNHPGRPKVQPPGTPWRRPELGVDGEIALDSASPSAAETRRSARGGRFVQTGWTAVQKRDLLLLELKQGFPADCAGAVELEKTNLDFDAQVNDKKQHFFNLYASPVGCNTTVPSNFVTLRGGNYTNRAGHRGIKVLWRAGGERGEKAPCAARPKWDRSATYNWRVEWTATELCVFRRRRENLRPRRVRRPRSRCPAQIRVSFHQRKRVAHPLRIPRAAVHEDPPVSGLIASYLDIKHLYT